MANNDNNSDPDYVSGAVLLARWNCTTRETKLERACKALMEQIETLHVEHEGQSLKDAVTDPDVFCSCADAYRMGHEALKEDTKQDA